HRLGRAQGGHRSSASCQWCRLAAKGWCSFAANHWCILSRVLTHAPERTAEGGERLFGHHFIGGH
ncbi:MAG: hypothetical protein ACYDAR_17045, partial [Thermomicrobiales bacterium]